MGLISQLDLFDHVLNAFAQAGDTGIHNDRLYKIVGNRAQLDDTAINNRELIGRSKQPHSLIKRKIRWHQQSLKHLGLIRRVDGVRGLWELTEEGKVKLKKAKPNVALIAYSTDLGVAIWGTAERVFNQLDVPISLCLTSPPYPLAKARAYGNPSEQEYVDFICKSLEPIVKNLVPGGSIALNISQDIFMKGICARSLYPERLVLALCDRLSLYKMDCVIWHNPSKPPGPVQYASIERVHLNVAYEMVYIFTNNPKLYKADNRRVLEPHSEKHTKLMLGGGEKRVSINSDGAYVIKQGSYSNFTEGKIPRNVLVRGHACADQRQYKRHAREMGLPPHGAPFPRSVAEFFIKFLTEIEDVVVDLFSGSNTTGREAEEQGRFWIATECMLEYALGSSTRFTDCKGYWRNPALMNH
jgi:site-specific DNA-methyltransferase (cytosine-N4-specific)